jgi:quercetin dioxygenase-like cupin family protein
MGYMMAEQRSAQPHPAPEDLAGLVQIQPGSIVSRTIIKREHGNVTLFGFDADEQLSEHTSPFEARIIILSGRARITIDGEAYPLEAGQTLTLPAGRPHAVKAITPAKMLLIMIRD